MSGDDVDSSILFGNLMGPNQTTHFEKNLTVWSKALFQMRVGQTLGLSILMLTLATPICGDQPVVRREKMTEAIIRALPHIEERGQWWIDKKGCMSCHRVSFMAWSHVEAKSAGITVDTNKLNRWIDWCHDDLFQPIAKENQKHPGEKKINRNLSGGAQMLAALAGWEASPLQKEKIPLILAAMREGQQNSGQWNPAGQLPSQKRSLVETTHVITLWNSLAIQTLVQFGSVERNTVEPMLESAAKFLREYEGGESSEWMALKALFLKRSGNQKGFLKMIAQLSAEQNEDGGFGWISGAESDVLATSQIVFLMQEIGSAEFEKLVTQAVDFLLKSQQPDGSWKVQGTKKKAKERHTETASYWGSAWAVISLSRALRE